MHSIEVNAVHLLLSIWYNDFLLRLDNGSYDQLLSIVIKISGGMSKAGVMLSHLQNVKIVWNSAGFSCTSNVQVFLSF